MKILIGTYLLLMSEMLNKKHDVRIGTCSPNGIGDDDLVAKLGASIVRVPHDQAVLYSQEGKYEYFVTIGSSRDSNEAIADAINKMWNEMSRKPLFFAVTNEENEFLTEDVYHIREHVKPNITVIKGAHSAAVENAGEAVYDSYFNDTRTLDEKKLLPHLLHFYLTPTWKKFNFVENFKRKALLAYTVHQLKKRGYHNLWITEAHDGTTKSKTLEPHGDYVYASGWGFKEIVKLSRHIGVNHVFYYQSPYPYYKGNTMLGWESSTGVDDESKH